MPPRPGRYIVKAEKLTASYEPGKLTLTAVAIVPPYVSDVTFELDPWFGGVKVDIGGSFGTPVPGPDRREEIKQTLDITLTMLTTPSHFALVVTQDHPNGTSVPIKGWPPLQDGDSANQPPTVPIDTGTGDRVIDQVNTPFTIRQVLGELNITSSITEIHDKEYVKLLSARIDGTSIVWEFEGIKVGNTNVTVHVGSRHPPFVFIVQHDVIIVDIQK